MWSLKLRMFLLTMVLFAIIFAVVIAASYALGMFNLYLCLAIAIVIMLVQYFVSPKMVEMSMNVKYLDKNEYPKLQEMVRSIASKANIPTPRVGVAEVSIPNAFTFGRSVSDARICVTRSILNLLSEDELKAVIGHEMSHIKNRDVLTITLLSVIPIMLYLIARQFMFTNYRRERSGSNAVLIGLVAFIFYFVTNLLVLYASRIREHFADKGSIDLGNRPSSLASALYKLVYGAARMPKEAIKDVEGMKAFFASDPSRAANEFSELKQLDLDKSGTISEYELAAAKYKYVQLGFGDRMLELLSTHPNMLMRVKRLAADGSTTR